MSAHSSIEWTDATWNPITGCSVVSPGCTNCYAMKLAGGRLQHHPTRQGLTTPSKAGPVWNGKVRLNEGMLTDPLRWRRPRRIFVCAHGDLFHESVPDEWIDKVFAVMALAPHHTFQVLTKRADRMRAYMRDFVAAHRSVSIAMSALGFKNTEANLQKLTQGHYADNFRPLPNVWLGVSAEDQERADQRIPDLLQTPAAVRFLSAEPLSVDAVRAEVAHAGAGAVALFLGLVRDENEGRAVTLLEYSAYEPMAVSEMRRIAEEVQKDERLMATLRRIGALPDRTVAVTLTEDGVRIGSGGESAEIDVESAEHIFAKQTK